MLLGILYVGSKEKVSCFECGNCFFFYIYFREREREKNEGFAQENRGSGNSHLRYTRSCEQTLAHAQSRLTHPRILIGRFKIFSF